jgi:hypothetical protein
MWAWRVGRIFGWGVWLEPDLLLRFVRIARCGEAIDDWLWNDFVLCEKMMGAGVAGRSYEGIRPSCNEFDSVSEA